MYFEINNPLKNEQEIMSTINTRNKFINLLLHLLMIGLWIGLNSFGSLAQVSTKLEPTVNDLNFYKVKVENLERSYALYYPEVSLEKQVPLVLVLHGGRSNIRRFAKRTHWLRLAEKEKFAVAFLQAQEVCLLRKGVAETAPFWVTALKEKKLCPEASFVDDGLYIDQVLKALLMEFNIDKTLIYAAGFSNGMGLILQNLIVNRPQVFAAYGGVGSMIYLPYQGQVELPLMMIIGQKDKTLSAHSGVAEFDMENQNSVFNDPTHKTCFMHLKNYLQVGDEYDWSVDDDTLTIDFYPNTNNTNSYLKYVMIKGLRHRFPNGKKIGMPLDGAVLLWDFFKNYKLEKGN